MTFKTCPRAERSSCRDDQVLSCKEQRRIWKVDEGLFVATKRLPSDASFGRGACLDQVFDAVPPEFCHTIERVDLSTACLDHRRKARVREGVALGVAANPQHWSVLTHQFRMVFNPVTVKFRNRERR